jgi:hypothetical protein
VAGDGGTRPRRLHRARLALLRPAAAAARRLVIVAARGLEPAVRGHKPDAGILIPARGSLLRAPGGRLGFVARLGMAGGEDTHATPQRPGFRLFDPLPVWRRPIRQAAVPRITVPGFSTPFPVAPRLVPSPRDPIDAARLAARLEALASVLDDLPRHARRFARWRAAKAAPGAQARSVPGPGRFRRSWPLRPGRPPGHRSRRSKRPAHAVHTVLDDLHGLAVWALNDTL